MEWGIHQFSIVFANGTPSKCRVLNLDKRGLRVLKSNIPYEVDGGWLVADRSGKFELEEKDHEDNDS